MSTSPHQASGGWVSEAPFDDQLDLPSDESVDAALVDDVTPEASFADAEPLFDQEAPYVEAPATSPEHEAAYAEDSYEFGPSTPQPRATVYASLPGMPGRGVIVMTSVATAATAILDFALTGGLSYFFDLTFVVICLVAAMAVRGHDLFTTGVLPPIAFGLSIAVIAVVAPATFATGVGVGQVFLTGLTAHAGALVFGYGTALLTVAARAAHHRSH
jgi:Domain of unknown function (DUF6542)